MLTRRPQWVPPASYINPRLKFRYPRGGQMGPNYTNQPHRTRVAALALDPIEDCSLLQVEAAGDSEQLISIAV